MATLGQVVAWCAGAGWRGRELYTAAAVALAESGGNPAAKRDARKNPDGGNDLGLFQINDKWHPEVKNIAWNDGAANAKLAYTIQQKSGWGQWAAHNNGAYLLYLPTVTPVVNAYLATHPGDAVDSAKEALVPDVAGALLAVADQPVRLLKWLTDSGTQKRIAKGIVGGALIIGALLIFARPAVSAAANIVPVGKVAKMAKGLT